jgi:hypothetical protein
MWKELFVRDFSKQQFASVMALLSKYGLEKWQVDLPRVQLAVLKRAHGRFEALQGWIEDAKKDFRDVLTWAEYPAYSKNLVSG